MGGLCQETDDGTADAGEEQQHSLPRLLDTPEPQPLASAAEDGAMSSMDFVDHLIKRDKDKAEVRKERSAEQRAAAKKDGDVGKELATPSKTKLTKNRSW